MRLGPVAGHNIGMAHLPIGELADRAHGGLQRVGDGHGLIGCVRDGFQEQELLVLREKPAESFLRDRFRLETGSALTLEPALQLPDLRLCLLEVIHAVQAGFAPWKETRHTQLEAP